MRHISDRLRPKGGEEQARGNLLLGRYRGLAGGFADEVRGAGGVIVGRLPVGLRSCGRFRGIGNRVGRGEEISAMYHGGLTRVSGLGASESASSWGFPGGLALALVSSLWPGLPPS